VGLFGVPIWLVGGLLLTIFAGRAAADDSPVQTTNPALQASLDRLARSASWREALDAVRATGRRAIVVTPNQLRTVNPASRRDDDDQFDDTLLAEVAPVVDGGLRVDAVVIVVNLALLQQRHEAQRLLPIEFEMDLDRILVHEIYGHAIPYLLAGTLAGRCADPQPRERAIDACSIRRENTVRAELGLGRRVDYGLQGLSLSRQR
jgi:hypothetical protein